MHEWYDCDDPEDATEDEVDEDDEVDRTETSLVTEQQSEDWVSGELESETAEMTLFVFNSAAIARQGAIFRHSLR